MAHEYFSRGMWAGSTPLAFANDYYAHYPKVAIGHWPPVFYLYQSVWLMVFGISRGSILMLTAATTATLGLLTTWLCRREGVERPIAALAGAVTALLPQSLATTLEVMADPLTAATTLAAAILGQRWLWDPSGRRACVFAAASSVAILTKGNAAALTLAPPLAIAVRGRLRLLRDLKFWIPTPLLFLLVFPWYWSVRNLARAEFVPGYTESLPARMAHALGANLQHTASLCGYLLLILALLSLRRGWARRWEMLAALPVAAYLFVSIVSPHTEARLLLVSAAVLCWAATIGVAPWGRWRAGSLLIGGLAFAHWMTPVAAKPQKGFVPAMAWAAGRPELFEAPMLVSSNGLGEGAWIAELALREAEPKATVVRASKLLAASTWMGDNYRLLVSTPEDVLRVLSSKGVGTVILHSDPARGPLPHQRLLEDAIRSWRLEAAFNEVRIFRRH
jgi:hypothetical protein